MLKKVYFDGMILVDLKKEKSTEFDYEHYIREALSDYSDCIEVSSESVKKFETVKEF